MVCTSIYRYTSGMPTPHVVLGFDAEALGAYHPGDVGPGVNSSMTLIGLSLNSSQ
jgi:hypothetical protein